MAIIDIIIVYEVDKEEYKKIYKDNKKKFEKTGVVKEMRERKEFTKPCVKNRFKRIRAAYKLHLQQEAAGRKFLLLYSLFILPLKFSNFFIDFGNIPTNFSHTPTHEKINIPFAFIIVNIKTIGLFYHQRTRRSSPPQILFIFLHSVHRGIIPELNIEAISVRLKIW